MKTLLTIWFFTIVWLSGCKEPFPVYEEPKDVLTASMTRLSLDTLYYIQDDQGNTYEFDLFRINLYVTNAYPQLLQGDALISGRMNFFVTSPIPKIGNPYTLTRSDLVQPPVFQNTIAVQPNHSAEFRLSLLPDVGSAGMIYDGVPSNEVILPDSTVIFTYAPMTITIDATVQIFQRVQPIKAEPLTFKQVFVHIIYKTR